MAKKVAMTGNGAVALAMRQINPDVCAAYPITPSTDIMQQFSRFVADGAVHTNLVTVESEHSAMSACIGAAAAGGRVMNATSANGLALMWEMLYIAAGNRLPIILSCVNRALSAPINIHGDHSDSMGARDSGWVQIYAENAQEAYDNTVQAVRIAEHFDVRLPVMSCFDGFIISHSIENLFIEEDTPVREFIGEYKSPNASLLDVDTPISMGPLALQDYYMEYKKQQHEAMKSAKDVIVEVGKEFGKKFGREYGLFETYKLEDADVAVVVLNSAAGTTKVIVDELRAKGIKAGLLKPRVFRPFPYLEVAEALKGCKAICVMDRCDSFGSAGGPLFTEFRSALYDVPSRPLMINKIFGLGGRDLGLDDIRKVYAELAKLAESGKNTKAVYEYISVRG
jgi:pyruvate ferredoxin oxidoreductase alpha subunit